MHLLAFFYSAISGEEKGTDGVIDLIFYFSYFILGFSALPLLLNDYIADLKDQDSFNANEATKMLSRKHLQDTTASRPLFFYANVNLGKLN